MIDFVGKKLSRGVSLKNCGLTKRHIVPLKDDAYGVCIHCKVQELTRLKQTGGSIGPRVILILKLVLLIGYRVSKRI